MDIVTDVSCRSWDRPLRGLAIFAVALLIVGGCSVPDGLAPNGDALNENAGEQSLKDIESKSEILNLTANFAVSGDEFISLFYTIDGAPDRIDAFFVPVADTSPGSGAIGDPQVFAPNVAARGVDDEPVSIALNTAGIPAGNYRLGLEVYLGEESFTLTTVGLVLIEDPPDPIFREPTVDLSIDAGVDVNITFDAQKVPEQNVQWRAFYARFDTRDSDKDGVRNGEDDCPGTPSAERESADVSGCSPTQVVTNDFDNDSVANDVDECPGSEVGKDVDSAGCSQDQHGTQIATGKGNVGRPVWRTDNVPTGTYRIGVSATDTGKSVAGTLAEGKFKRVITRFTDATIEILPPPPLPKPPTLVFTAPSSDVGTFLTEVVTTTFEASINEEGAVGFLSLFLDPDTTPNSGNEDFLFIDSDPTAIVSWEISTAELAEGTYNIGGTVSDGINEPVTVYAPGKLIVVKTPTLTVTAPNISVPVRPDVAVEVAWETNVPPSAGTVDVFYRQLDADGVEIGGEIEILPPSSTETTTVMFSRSVPGIYRIRVRLQFNDESVDDVVKVAPLEVRISSLPAILWVGAPALDLEIFDAAIFEGVNFEDNAGTTLAAAGDLNGDNKGDFIIGARYGKPFFTNPSGVGPGEAYLVYGGQSRLTGLFNLNSVGTDLLKGVSFTGIRTPQRSNDTDGLTAITPLPDLDNDGRPELMFGFPNTDSRGHNANSFQDGVRPEDSLCSLEKSDQFLRGGVVIVSSKTAVLSDPDAGFEPVINLDEVGQRFSSIRPFTDIEEVSFMDIFNWQSEDPPCQGDCVEPQSDGILDALTPLASQIGFVDQLAGNYIETFVFNGCAPGAWYLQFGIPCFPVYCGPGQICWPNSPLLTSGAGWTGFYPSDADVLNPLGARIIGIGMGDAFGTSVTISNQLDNPRDADIIISAPKRTARGMLCCQGDIGTEVGPEINGLKTSINNKAGVAYLFKLRNLWDPDSQARIPPRPHQYMVGQPSHCDTDFPGVEGLEFPDRPRRILNIDAIRVAGHAEDQLRNIIGIVDFNGDGRNDFAIGAPNANNGLGRVSIAFRREQGIEDDYVLEKLSMDPNDPDRLTGVQIIAEAADAFGASLATGVDFNGDGVGDLIVGSPNAFSGRGEVVVIFSDALLVSPEGGITISNLLATRRGAKILGNSLDTNGQFGFNVVNAGDVNGDGVDDLLIAAPDATPRFDPNPTDDTDELTEPGLDLDFDGQRDDIGDFYDLPDFDDTMANAGLVYIIYGSKGTKNRLDLLGGESTVGIEELGRSLHGFMIAGRRAGDRLGGGDAGNYPDCCDQNTCVDEDVCQNKEKEGRGRSNGLASAGDIDGDGKDDILIGAVLADPRRDRTTGVGLRNGGEAYLIYGGAVP